MSYCKGGSCKEPDSVCRRRTRTFDAADCSTSYVSNLRKKKDMKRKKEKYIPLEKVLQYECLTDILMFAHLFYLE